MLLHNLFHIVYNTNSFTASNKNITTDYPYNFTAVNGQTLQKGNSWWPEYISAVNNIEADNTIFSNGNVEYVAGESITLKNGFTVEAGASFTASVDPDYLNVIDYRRLQYDNLCSSDKSMLSEKSKSDNHENYEDNRYYESSDATEDVYESPGLLVFPNPSNGRFTILIDNKRNSEDAYSIKILDIAGKVILNENEVKNRMISVNLENIENGFYMVHVLNRNSISTEKLIIQR